MSTHSWSSPNPIPPSHWPDYFRRIHTALLLNRPTCTEKPWPFYFLFYPKKHRTYLEILIKVMKKIWDHDLSYLPVSASLGHVHTLSYFGYCNSSTTVDSIAMLKIVMNKSIKCISPFQCWTSFSPNISTYCSKWMLSLYNSIGRSLSCASLYRKHYISIYLPMPQQPLALSAKAAL